MKINLGVVMEAIELSMEGTDYFYNIDTGESVIYNEYVLTMEEQEKFSEVLERSPFKYIKLPGRFEINDYNIMENFIWSLKEGKSNINWKTLLMEEVHLDASKIPSPFIIWKKNGSHTGIRHIVSWLFTGVMRMNCGYFHGYFRNNNCFYITVVRAVEYFILLI